MPILYNFKCSYPRRDDSANFVVLNKVPCFQNDTDDLWVSLLWIERFIFFQVSGFTCKTCLPVFLSTGHLHLKALGSKAVERWCDNQWVLKPKIFRLCISATVTFQVASLFFFFFKQIQRTNYSFWYFLYPFLTDKINKSTFSAYCYTNY